MYIDDAISSCKQRDSPNCFFRVNGLISFVNLNFKGNKASDGSTSIYGGVIEHCQVYVGNVKQRGYEVFQTLTKNSTELQKEYVSQDAYEISLCHGTTSGISVPRGQVFNISAIFFGEFKYPVNESVAFSVNYFDEQTSSEVIGQPYNNIRQIGCRNLGFSIISSKNQTVYLNLYPAECLSHSASLTVTIDLDNCPPGFELIDNSCNCQETFFKVTDHKDLCDSSNGFIKCPRHDWMRSILDVNLTYEGFMWSPKCPAQLCHNDKDNQLNFSSDNVDFLCLEHRTAMLCGACLQNYSLTLSSLKYFKCDNNNYLSFLLVFALAGVSLITSLLLLNTTVANGTINGLIFYANILNIIKDIIFPQDELPPNPITIFFSWLNLDFGIPSCFYTWLQFVFPFYLWFLVGLIILACKYSSRAIKLFGSNPVAVLATVVLMSYSKLLHTSQQILSYVTVYYSNGTQEKRWKMDPNLLYFHGKHFPLGLFGILIVIVLLIPYIILLSFGHYLQKYTNKKGLKWFIKFKPILNAYYAPFCKNTRYWVGFLIFIRTSFSITYSTLKNTSMLLF